MLFCSSSLSLTTFFIFFDYTFFDFVVCKFFQNNEIIINAGKVSASNSSTILHPADDSNSLLRLDKSLFSVQICFATIFKSIIIKAIYLVWEDTSDNAH